jgi:pantoate--beta-alanine ligase
MLLLTTIAQARDWRAASEGSVGLVPTMGYLHAGHLSLVERARRENRRVAASIFVNPTQFGPGEDLARYPRDLERDRHLLAEARCDALFAPEAAEMYPPGAATFVDVGPVASPLEGERRPGHFRGVATVVLKLFGIVQPAHAYFGEKDAQQLAVIRRMARDLDLPVEIVGCPTVREPDGLALSSRNSYLTPAERRAAGVLFRALSAARELLLAGERRGDALRQAMRGTLESEPLARADYVSVADPESFRELEGVNGPALLALAAFLGRTRLIDNLRVGADETARPASA